TLNLLCMRTLPRHCPPTSAEKRFLTAVDLAICRRYEWPGVGGLANTVLIRSLFRRERRSTRIETSSILYTSSLLTITQSGSNFSASPSPMLQFLARLKYGSAPLSTNTICSPLKIFLH